MKKIFVYMFFLATVLYSCDDYLDVTPKGKLLPVSTQDFSEMMGDPSLPSEAYPLIDVMSDNCYMEDDRLASSFMNSSGKAYGRVIFFPKRRMIQYGMMRMGLFIHVIWLQRELMERPEEQM